MRRDDGLSPGDHGDPVADSIRREQQRDAMPSAQEAKELARKQLASEGCHICGEDDPDKLTREMPWTHACKDLQHQRPEPRVICKEGHPSKRERKLSRMQERADREDVPVVLYECKTTRAAEKPDTPDESDGPTPPYHRHRRGNRPEPTVKTFCGGGRCKSEIDTIVYPGGDAGADAGEDDE